MSPTSAFQNHSHLILLIVFHETILKPDSTMINGVLRKNIFDWMLDNEKL